MANTKDEKLFQDFPPISTETWMEKIVADLKGADFEKKLVWKTDEGFSVNPFYREEDNLKRKHLDSLPSQFPFVRGNKLKDNSWYVRQNVVVTNAEEANEKALDILGKGVDSIEFCFKNREQVNEKNISKLLNGICLTAIEINFSTPGGYKNLIEIFIDYLKSQKYDLTKIKGSLNYDPLGRMLKKGNACSSRADFDPKHAAELIEISKELPGFRVISVNARYFNNAGAYSFQELGYALSMGNEYLSTVTGAGASAYSVAKNIKFNFAVASNYFMEIAKFRAARMLWANIVKAYVPQCELDKCNGAEVAGFCTCAAKMIIHAETAFWNMTSYDAYVNMLRTQTEAMSAAIAGVDSMTVAPFDKPYKTSDTFSERIARNQQLLLKEEAHFDKVVDPSAGSYYIESLTESIANEAWKLAVSVDNEGGFIESVKAGKIQAEVKKSGLQRLSDIAKRKEILLGTNQYPNFNEKME